MPEGLRIPGLFGFYILIGQTPVPTDDIFEVAANFEDITSRKVKDTYLGDAAIHISTVFSVIDHAFMGPPLLFETMVCWPEDGWEEQTRCSTWLQAEAQHEAMVRYVMSLRPLWDYCMRRLWQTVGEAVGELATLLHRVHEEG